MGSEIVIANCLRIAHEDLEGAKALAAINNRNAIYLCEQAGEKIVIALQVSENIKNTRDHRLSEKISTLPDANPVKIELRKIEHLEIYATTYRYPTPGGRVIQTPSAPKVKEEIDQVFAILVNTATRFGVDLAKIDHPAKTAGPIR
jgi:hypothetical protein